MIALSRSRASAIFLMVSSILSPFLVISSADLPMRKVIVFQAFTQNPQSDWFSSLSSRTFLLISAISASICMIACAFIASLNLSCASAAMDIDFAVLSMAIPRLPYRPWSVFVSFSASSISALESFSFSASCWSRSIRSWSVARSWSPLSRSLDISSESCAVCFVADAMYAHSPTSAPTIAISIHVMGIAQNAVAAAEATR